MKKLFFVPPTIPRLERISKGEQRSLKTCYRGSNLFLFLVTLAHLWFDCLLYQQPQFLHFMKYGRFISAFVATSAIQSAKF